jgi:hypothetical protein
MDPNLVAPETRKIQAAINAASAQIGDWERAHERRSINLTESDVRSALTQVGGTAALLQRADRKDRAELYRPSASHSATKERQPGWNESTPGWR